MAILDVTLHIYIYSFSLIRVMPPSRACADAAMRTAVAGGDGKEGSGTIEEVRQKDLLAAGEAEVNKLKSGNFEVMYKLFA